MQLAYLVHLTDLIDSQHRHHLTVTKMGTIMRPQTEQHDDDDDLIIHWTDLIAFLAVMNYMNPSTCCYLSLNRLIIFLQNKHEKRKWKINIFSTYNSYIYRPCVSKIRLDVINDLFNFLWHTQMEQQSAYEILIFEQPHIGFISPLYGTQSNWQNSFSFFAFFFSSFLFSFLFILRSIKMLC